MKYNVHWRSDKAGGYPDWQLYKYQTHRQYALIERRYLKGLGHEVKISLGEDEIEIEVEDDDQ